VFLSSSCEASNTAAVSAVAVSSSNALAVSPRQTKLRHQHRGPGGPDGVKVQQPPGLEEPLLQVSWSLGNTRGSGWHRLTCKTGRTVRLSHVKRVCVCIRRYTGTTPNPPPGSHYTSPSENMWNTSYNMNQGMAVSGDTPRHGHGPLRSHRGEPPGGRGGVCVHTCVLLHMYLCVCVCVYMCVCVCVCVCVSKCVCVYIYIYVCIYIYTYVCGMYLCVCVCMYLCVCIYVYIYICVCLYMCVYLYVCVCIYLYMSVYIYICVYVFVYI